MGFSLQHEGKTAYFLQQQRNQLGLHLFIFPNTCQIYKYFAGKAQMKHHRDASRVRIQVMLSLISAPPQRCVPARLLLHDADGRYGASDELPW
jgi:hypothetical protein